MKLALSLSCLVAGASAFSSSSLSNSRLSTALNEAAPEPIGALKPAGFFGQAEWNAITEYGSEDTGKFLRAAELKHGRSAMIATLGFLFHEFGWTLDKISPHEFLSVTQGVKFADLAAMTPLEAMKSVPAEGITQMFVFCGLFEIYELTHAGDWKEGEIVRDSPIAPGLKPGGLTGDLGFNPLNFDVTDDLRVRELQNGRAAMVAISMWVFHDAIPGSVPVPLPWDT